jgi:hypothetical protein
MAVEAGAIVLAGSAGLYSPPIRLRVRSLVRVAADGGRRGFTRPLNGATNGGVTLVDALFASALAKA